MNKWITTAISTSLVAAGLSAGTAMAQAPAAQTAPPPATAPAANFSDTQLQKFVGASQKVAMISEQYTPKLESARDDATKSEVIKQADNEMVAAVQQEGLTVDEFNGINRALQQDPTLANRVQKMAK